MANLQEWFDAFNRVGGDNDAGFMLALAAGGLIVFLFAMNKFGAMPIGGMDPPIAKFPTRILASRGEFARAMTVYVMTMIAALVIFSALGPAAVKICKLPLPPEWLPVLPLGIALILVGAIREGSYLEQIEHQLGQFARERAFIPMATLVIADRIAAADFDFTRYQDSTMLALPALAGVEREDFTRPRGSLEYRWARLCVLAYELEEGRAAAIVGGPRTAILRTLETDRQTLANDVVEYRAQLRQGRSYAAAPLHGRIREMLRAYHILLAGAVRHDLAPDADVTLALVTLGFICAESHEPMPERGNLIIGGLGVMAACLLVLVMTAAALSGLWHASRSFPASAIDAFLWCLPAVFAHGFAIALADRMRTRALSRGKWYSTDAHGSHSPLANLIRVGIVCGVGGYAVFVLWGAMYQKELTPGLFKGMAAYAMMPATTGAFYAFTLDNIELRRRPPRWLEVVLQASVTAFFGCLACCAWFSLVGDDPWSGYDLIIMVTLFGAVIGGSLGWYIPASVPQDRYDPLGKVRVARVHKLEEVARASFDDRTAAQQWLDTTSGQLGNRAPRAAAYDGVDGYDDAIRLLDRNAVAG